MRAKALTESTGPTLLFRGRSRHLGIQANLDENDMGRVMKVIGRFVIKVNNKRFPDQQHSSIILLPGTTTKKFMDRREVDELVKIGIEVFQILYYDMQWTLSRCLSKLIDACMRRLDSPGTWQVDVQEGIGMYAAAEKEENDVAITESFTTNP
jgi:hypothetical protein